ncbi:MAG: N-acetylmuramate alpha-1-phosphate uridylyltransferase MurU [Rudaea sp.]
MERALIFAAGRGERMRPLTDVAPKPLLDVRGKPLIVWHLEKLVRAGVREVVINTSHLANQFAERLGDGSQWQLRIRYSYEGPEPLETGGGMRRALAFLGHEPFIAVNGDVFTDFDFSTLPQRIHSLAYLVMVDNPAHNPNGDFVLRDGKLFDEPSPRLTFAGIGAYRSALLDGCGDGKFPLAPILREAMRREEIEGVHFHGAWNDIGTPQRLAELNSGLRPAD